MEYIFVLELPEKDRAENLVEYLNYSGISSKVEYNDESEAYRILVDKSNRTSAKKYMNAFFVVEAEEKAAQKAASADEAETIEDETVSEETTGEFDWERDDETVAEDKTSDEVVDEKAVTEDTEEAKNEAQEPYVPKAEKYENFKSSAWTFIGFSIIGAIFLALNIVGILNIYSTLISQIVFGIIVVSCLLIGLWCLKGINKLKEDAASEENFTETLNAWLKENITEEFIAANTLSDAADEVNYIKINEAIKELVNNTFGELDDGYLESVIDNFYSENFENEEYEEEDDE